jgi:hypothetical protein
MWPSVPTLPTRALPLPADTLSPVSSTKEGTHATMEVARVGPGHAHLGAARGVERGPG